jgi:hypothetical protein
MHEARGHVAESSGPPAGGAEGIDGVAEETWAAYTLACGHLYSFADSSPVRAWRGC